MAQFQSTIDQSSVISSKELEDLKNSEKELRNRLHMAELSSARLLRRARSAEAKYLETSECYFSIFFNFTKTIIFI